ncbi:MAG TPA: CHRD domain-containing protein, partial [Thermoanaerobaculia bacterium]|nr:CHRD domain-containing protein [Thermoanaerobaculia bacterium]
CSNLGNGPAGTQTCPDVDGALSISGTITSADVLAINSQGIPAGGIGEVVNAIKKGIAYANLHTDLFPGGEVRGQIVFRGKAKEPGADANDSN